MKSVYSSTRTERRYGEFYRVIPLPDGADAERARAEFKDGMLKAQTAGAMDATSIAAWTRANL